MAQAVQPQAQQQQQVQQPVQEQQQQRFFLGDMADHQIQVLQQVLQQECIERHSQDGALIGTLLGVAALVAGVFTAYVVGGGIIGAALGFATFLILGKVFSEVYHGFRNQDYLDAARALQAMNFREYIVVNRLDLSADTIVQIHQQYKQHLANQVQELRQ